MRAEAKALGFKIEAKYDEQGVYHVFGVKGTRRVILF